MFCRREGVATSCGFEWDDQLITRTYWGKEMVRRKSPDWRYSGTIQKRKRGAKFGSRSSGKGWWGFLSVFGVEPAKRQRQSPTLLPKSGASRTTLKRRRSIIDIGGAYSLQLANHVADRVANKKWRPLSLSEGLIWIAVGAVSIAFLVLMAKGALLLAAGIFVLMLAFAWRELGER